MAELHEMANTPLEIKIGGRTLKVRRLTLEEAMGVAEGNVLSIKIAQMQTIAESLKGKEKVDYLAEATRNLPSGATLQQEVAEELGTVSGVRRLVFEAAKHDQPEITLKEITGVITNQDADEIGNFVAMLCGLPQSETKEEDEDEGQDGGSEKN